MASGHRKRKAALLRSVVLTPVNSLTNVSEADRGSTTNQNNLMNIAIYSKAGNSPTFTAASTTALSNATSNADGAFTKASLTGEKANAGTFVVTSMSGNIGIVDGSTKHYYFPFIGNQTDLSSSNPVSSPVIIYSNEGPQASYVPYYLGGNAQTSSILFGTQITGTGTPTHVVVYVGGELSSGDFVNITKANAQTTLFGGRFLTGSDTAASSLLGGQITSASATDLSSALYRKAFLVATSAIASAAGLCVQFSSSAKTSTTPVAGVFVVISSGSFSPAP